MSTICYLYNYNKYFNRRFKREASLSAYQALANPTIGPGHQQTASKIRVRTQANTNFDISDGVSARHVFNISKNEDDFYKYNEPDYCVVVDPAGNLTRWFVLECVRIRGGQFQVSLRRDLIADYYDKIQNVPFYVEKGMLDVNDPFIFNTEGMSFNQIKQSELLLKDKSLTPWVVGYLAVNNEAEDINITFDVESALDEIINYEDLPSRQQYIFDNYQSLQFLEGYEIGYKETKPQPGTVKPYRVNDYKLIRKLAVQEITPTIPVCDYEYSSVFDLTYNKTDGILYRKITSTGNDSAGMNVSDFTDLDNEFLSVLQDYFSQNYARKLSKEDMEFFKVGRYVKKDNIVYYLKIKLVSNTPFHFVRKNFSMNNYLNSNLGIETKGVLERAVEVKPSTLEFMGNNPDFDKNKTSFYIQEREYTIGYERYIYPSFKAKMTISASRRNLLDAPYGMFAIPVNSIFANAYEGQVRGYETSEKIALAAARAISVALGKEGVYDVQILPYCPMQKIISDEIWHYSIAVLDIYNLTEHTDYEWIKKESDNTRVGIVFYPDVSSGTFNIEVDTSNNPELREVIDSAIDKKVRSETDLIRFVSPNYASMYEINAQKNKGIDVINVDYEYRPYTPYIHVAPIFKGMYGQDFNDPKGLILSGDFSITTSANLWQEYQIQNKNYQLTFDRQIQNLDINNAIAMEKAKITAVTGTISNAASMAIGGGIAGAAIGGAAGSAGGGYGAVAGAAIGAVGGAIGGTALSIYGAMKDIELLGRQQSENRDYAIDMFTYQLGNIQALPNTLTKVTAINNNNKLYPTIEYYTCTDEEKNALRNKILYNGMTVMRIGLLNEFINKESESDLTYFKGQMVITNAEDMLYEANHEIVELYNEFMKGVYF